MNNLRLRVWDLIEVTYDDDKQPVLDWYDASLAVLITLNVLAVIFESVPSIGGPLARYFYAFEVFSVGVFTIEYVTRLWACTADTRYAGLTGRVRYALSPMVVIDLLSFAPFYVWFLPLDLRFLRVLRLLRLLRVFKLGRYSRSLTLIGRVLRRKASDLAVAVVVLILMLVLASSVMYYVERDAQPEAFSSIPAAMWWGMATFTTVGYGDIYPVTTLGKIAGALVSLLGIGIFALPAGIIASGFSEERESQAGQCPHCGHQLE